MVDSTILTVAGDHGFLTLLRQQLHEQGGSGNPMIVAATIDEACSLLATARPRLIVVHWAGQGARYGELDRLLWATSVLARRIPVLVIADRYRTDQAIILYRMGVTEYISRTHHADQFGRILGAYLPNSSRSEPRVTASAGQPEPQPAKTWVSPAPQSRAAQVV
jgi:DNA-binding NarL/FixJ family response regulator